MFFATKNLVVRIMRYFNSRNKILRHHKMTQLPASFKLAGSCLANRPCNGLSCHSERREVRRIPMILRLDKHHHRNSSLALPKHVGAIRELPLHLDRRIEH